MSVAERTRRAVDEQPFLREALRAGVLNYTAAARYLDVGEPDAVAAALRRYAADVGTAPSAGSARVTMESGFGRTDPGERALLSVGDTAFVPEEGSLTALIARGEPTPVALARVLMRCESTDIEVVGAGISDSLVLVVERRDGPTALRLLESVFE